MRTRALNDSIIFPGGKTKAFTMSYDDGTIHDKRLIEIMNRYGIKGTFNLNSGFLSVPNVMKRRNEEGVLDCTRIDPSEVPALYQGHEVAGHGLYHASPTGIGTSAFMYETIEDKKKLEDLTGYLIRGYAYPFGAYDEESKNILKMAGYHYARPVDTTGKFNIPEDFLEWKGTCHHNDPKLMELLEEFCQEGFRGFRNKLFYLWGHSYEFDGDHTWDMIENALKYVSEHGENIWFATNIEIYDYVMAFRSLEYSADANMVYNPSRLPVTVSRMGTVVTIEPGETAHFEDK